VATCYNPRKPYFSGGFLAVGNEVHTARELLGNWRNDLFSFLQHDLPKILLVVLGSMLVIRIFRAAIRRLSSLKVLREHTDIRARQLKTLTGVIASVGTFIILFIAAMQILPLLGFNLGPLLASAGIAGLAIGFGAQTLVKDVINGFFVLLENQYDIGDVVRMAGVKGTVEDMTLRRTVLRDDDGTLHYIPNSQLTIVSNQTRDWVQVALRVTVAYSESSDKINDLLREVGDKLRNNPRFSGDLIAEPQVPGIDKISGGEVEYLMLVKTRPGRQHDITRELRRCIKEVFQKNNVKPGGPGQVYVVAEPSSPA
jgi:moderate conductance mechanosensitive channel